MILAVASGKGGTGKTTVSVNLARVWGSPAQLLDCDVEEPNDHLFLSGLLQGEEEVSIPIPRVDTALCDGCGECSRFCQFNAIVCLGNRPLVFPELCHGCGGCAMVCPQEAISEVARRIGVVSTKRAGDITLIQGLLDVGVAMAPPLIRAVRARGNKFSSAIVDAPPGTTCPVIAAVRDADYLLLVTEPTAFGLHDLELAVEMVRVLGLRFGVVINRVGIGDDRVHKFCFEQGIRILGEIPDDRRVAELSSKGALIVDHLPGYRALFQRLADAVLLEEKFSSRSAPIRACTAKWAGPAGCRVTARLSIGRKPSFAMFSPGWWKLVRSRCRSTT